MSGYGDVKQKRIRNIIKWLDRTKGVEVKVGGRHSILRCIHNGESFPVPTSHKVVNKYIVKDLQEWLERNEICTKEEFDERL